MVVPGSTLIALLAVSPSFAQPLGELRQPIIYGEDDRRQVYEVEGALLQSLARQSVVALVSPRSLSYDSSGGVSIHAPSLGEAYNLCSGEAFANEPSLAFCTGVLIDDDLIATAGHCLGRAPEETTASCRSLALVFDYLYDAAGQLAPISADDVYRCRRVVTWGGSAEVAPDFGVIQLDRPVRAGLSPALFAPGEVAIGQRVNVIGFGSGLPAKIDSSASIIQSPPDGEYFTAQTDTFGGNSGSPLFDDAGQIVGLNVAGQPDWMTVGLCTAAVHATEGDEFHQRASRVLASICDSGWPSPRLCGTNPACGDGVCSPTEYCPGDCPAADCGDRVCEGGEPMYCRTDCPSFVEVPPEWICPPEYYGDRLGCDCDCGARDIDCDNPFQELYNCRPDSFCNAEGACERYTSTPTEPEETSSLLDEPSNNGRPVSADAPRPGDDLIVDERDLIMVPTATDVAESDDGGCAIAPRGNGAGGVASLFLLSLCALRRLGGRRRFA